MSSKSDVSSTALRQHSSSSSTTSPAAAINGMEAASIGDGFVMQDDASGNVFAAQLRPRPAAREYYHAAFGAITQGHYTEF
jgi:hypothetical protein